MNVNDLIKLSVGVVVGVLMLSAILVPVINDAAHDVSTTTYTNEGTETLTELDLTSAVTIVPTQTGWIVNDEALTVLTTNKYIFADTFKAATPNNSVATNVFAFANEAKYTYVTKIVVEDGTATFTKTYNDTTTTYTTDCSWLILSDSSGDLVYCAEGAYTNGDFYATYPEGGTSSGVNIVATVTDYAVTTTNGATVSGDTLIDVSENVTSSISTSDYYSVVTATYSDVDYTLGIIAPKTISITTPNSESTLLEVIPMLVTVGLIVGIVGVAFSRRE